MSEKKLKLTEKQQEVVNLMGAAHVRRQLEREVEADKSTLTEAEKRLAKFNKVEPGRAKG